MAFVLITEYQGSVLPPLLKKKKRIIIIIITQCRCLIYYNYCDCESLRALNGRPCQETRAEGSDSGGQGGGPGRRGGRGCGRAAPLPCATDGPRGGSAAGGGAGTGPAPPDHPPPPRFPRGPHLGGQPSPVPGIPHRLLRLFKYLFAADVEAADVRRLMPGWWQAPRIVCCLTRQAIIGV